MRWFLGVLVACSFLCNAVSGAADTDSDIAAGYEAYLGTGVTLGEEKAELKGRAALYADYDWIYDRVSDHGNSKGGEAGEVVLWPVARNKYVSVNFGYSASDNRLFFAPMLDLQQTLFEFGGENWSVSSNLEAGLHVNYDTDDKKARWGICGVSLQVMAIWEF